MIDKHVLRVSFTSQSIQLSVRPSVSPFMSHVQFMRRHSPDASLPGWACSPMYEMCNKKYLTKNFEEKCFSKSTENLKINKTFKSYLFLYSICFHSYTHLSNFRYDLILVVNEYQNLWISNFYAENKTFVLILNKYFFMYAIGLGDKS